MRTRHVTVPLVVAAAGGALAALGTRAVLQRQAAIARRLIGKPLGEEAIDADRVWKKRYGDPLDLLLLGDSIAAGLGAGHRRETLGARIAKGVAREAQRSVRLTTGAFVGAETRDLAAQLDGLPPGYRPDVAVVVVGGNDVTHRIPVTESVADLEACLARLHARGCPVVVGTCPDLGALRPVPQPLRALGSMASRQLAEAQREAALRSGAWSVSLATVVGPFFVSNPEEMFSLDRFHPSALGYRRTARALLPSVLAALGVNEEVPYGHHAPGPAHSEA